jgi:hypothetical protein
MLSVPASILAVFAALVAGLYASPDRWPKREAPVASRLKGLRSLLVIGLAFGLGLMVAALGWVAGIVAWAVAIMAAGVGAVSLASVRPVLARRLGMAAAGGAALLTLFAIGTA